MISTDILVSHSSDLKSFVGGVFGFVLGVFSVKYISVKNHDHLYQDAILVKTRTS